MTSSFLLNWTILSVSFFNTILLLWLGLTVLLNAERRTWGVWIIGGSLLLGGVFFVSHSAILGFDFTGVGPNLDFWWSLAWGPVVALPLAWYIAILWYLGFWDRADTPLHQRHRWPFISVVCFALLLVALFLFANPLPSLTTDLAVAGVPLLIALYPLYIVACIGLSLDALRHPGPSTRIMGEVARRRAQPWLMGTALLLLLISLLVGIAMMWLITDLNLTPRNFLNPTDSFALVVGGFDLIIASLIGCVALTLGQAITAYEVFTGKALPRQGLRRYWRNAVILAAGFGITVGLALTLRLRPIYSVLLTLLVMTVFYALSSWRAFAERDRYMRALRPFVASQQLYEHLLTASESDVASPFRALSENVLNARCAYLVAVGPLVPLMGTPLAYPASAQPTFNVASLAARFDEPTPMLQAIAPEAFAGAEWAVPLWSERGLIGLLLLGAKADGGLYLQEEIEIARASGERLIDLQASAEMARRLMALQRQRLTESQIVDRQTRRVLHDEVLPALHAAMLSLNANGRDEAMHLLSDAHHQIADVLRAMPALHSPEIARVGVLAALQQMCANDLASAFDRVTWNIEPEAEQHALTLAPLTAEVLFYAAREALRNAAHHARHADGRPLHITISAEWHEGLQLSIEDNGIGIEGNASKGSQNGLALHSTLLAVVGGTLAIESEPHQYTRVLMRLNE